MSWKKISSKQVYKNKWMEITEDEVETEFGKRLTFGVVRKEPFALIIPWDGEKFTLVGQYRYSVESFSWEFPQGHFQNNSIEETATGELREETGLKAEKIEEIGKLFLAPGHHSQICHIFLATGLIEGEKDLEEAEEGMKTKKVSIDEFKEMVKKEEIKDSPTIAAFGLLNTKGLLNCK